MELQKGQMKVGNGAKNNSKMCLQKNLGWIIYKLNVHTE